jgi:hypothetical protein
MNFSTSHVSEQEGKVRVELSRNFYHARREIQTGYRRTRVVQVAGDMTGTTAHVTYFTTLCGNHRINGRHVPMQPPGRPSLDGSEAR